MTPMAREHRDTEKTADLDVDDARRRARALEDRQVLARAQAAVEAFRRREFPQGEGIGPEQLPEFLREHG